MSLSQGYLTLKQKLIWSLRSQGYTKADIGRKLKITRQTVHKALNVANQKILQSLEETAIPLICGDITAENPPFFKL